MKFLTEDDLAHLVLYIVIYFMMLENEPRIYEKYSHSIRNSTTGDTYSHKMSTQHIGDGPPGDDDYMDLEGEDTNRATGSGRNPKAAAWDPE